MDTKYRPIGTSNSTGSLRRIVGRKSRKLLLVLLFVTSVLLLCFSLLRESISERWHLLGHRRPISRCSPDEYAEGKWIHRPYFTREGSLTKTYNRTSTTLPPAGALSSMTKSEDVHTFTRFDKCASSREYWWHLAADQPAQFDRFPGPTEWEWVPGGRCTGQEKNPGLRDWDREEVVRELVEGGGWLLVGDSVSENHFFSLSCLLYPHVIGRPDYSILTTMYDRAWPQHLYLNPSSPLLQTLKPPIGFNISTTPLVTFRRVDLLWSQEDLGKMHQELHPEFYQTPDFKLFGDEAVWTLSPKEYFDIFTKPLPEGNYATMIVSTGGHWTTNLFHGYHREPQDGATTSQPVWGYDGLIQFYQEVMLRWADDVQRLLNNVEARSFEWTLGKTFVSRRKREPKVLVRAYLPGHEDCHKQRVPWDEIKPFDSNWWNWRELGRFNDVFKTTLSDRVRYPDIHYLPIDRPARLRPDAHSTGDCLHIMSGAGVLEGWSHYIWHYITQEI